MIFENYLASFYNFHCQFSIDAITQVTNCNKFDMKFIIHQLSNLKKLKYRLLIFYENKLHHPRNIIYKLEPPAQSSKYCCKLGIDDCGCDSLLGIILDQFIELTDSFIGQYSLDSFFPHITFILVCLQAHFKY